jgi:hypothetical protein
VILPFVAARVKQTDQLSRYRIDTGQISAFSGVAPQTCHRQVGKDGSATVLSGYDMIDRECESKGSLRHEAVFAGISGTLADTPFPSPWHGRIMRLSAA